MLLPDRKKAKDPADRGFTVRDAMIFIGASAVTLALLHPLQRGALQRGPSWVLYLASFLVVLVSSTPAALILRLLGPRPPIHRLTRQPGFAASVAGSVILALGLATIGFLAMIRLILSELVPPTLPPALGGDPPTFPWWASVVLNYGVLVGPAVIATWTMLALSGRRRPARGWIDSFGRAIGIGWIILFCIKCGFDYYRLFD